MLYHARRHGKRVRGYEHMDSRRKVLNLWFQISTITERNGKLAQKLTTVAMIVCSHRQRNLLRTNNGLDGADIILVIRERTFGTQHSNKTEQYNILGTIFGSSRNLCSIFTFSRSYTVFLAFFESYSNVFLVRVRYIHIF